MITQNDIRLREVDWGTIDWSKIRKEVLRRQQSIAEAYVKCNNEGSEKKTYVALQYNLVKSLNANLYVIQKVSTNKGKNSPGVDYVVWDTPKKKVEAVKMLRAIDWKTYQAKPVRRVYIPKSNGKRRPLGIPTRIDRAYQCLWHLALDPIAECKADHNSYGFRKYRSANHLAQMGFLLFSKTKGSPKYARDLDIEGFFDNIRHDWLIKNIPMDKNVLKQWLYAGYVYQDNTYSTDSGVPQGGVISPTIANLTLDGLEPFIKKEVSKIRQKDITYVHVLRYADDVLITSMDKELLTKTIKPLVESFLSVRGLKLNMSKTKIAWINDGFDFVGFRFKRYLTTQRKNGSVFLIKPAPKSVSAFRSNITNLVKECDGVPTNVFRDKLNQKTRGWANYFSSVTSKKIFSTMDTHVWRATWKWVRTKENRLSVSQCIIKYYKRIGTRNWTFHCEVNGKKRALFRMNQLPIRRTSVVKKGFNPYLKLWDSYTVVLRKNTTQKTWILRPLRLKLLRNQGYICPVCEDIIDSEEQTEIHHKLSKKNGGTDNNKNLVVLHKACHYAVSYSKGTARARYRENGIIRDPDRE